MRAPVPEKIVSPSAAADNPGDHEEDLQYLHRHVRQARHLDTDSHGVLDTGIQQLDSAFAGAVRPGKIIEWGIPQGKNGRVIPLLFLRHHNLPIVWMYADLGLHVYAPAWASHGIDLQRLFFIRSSEPVKQLRPLFMDNLFNILVIDGPQKLSCGELAFIGQQARYNRQIVFLIRNYFLSRNRGTAQASMRVNCWQSSRDVYSINFIKGRHTKKINLDSSVVLHHGP